MDNRTQGAWIIHHTDKLQGIVNADNEYEAINLAGKCGLLLSSLAASDDQCISKARLDALSKASNINIRTEQKAILDELEKQKLIIRSGDEINVLGLTTVTTLEHTATIFYDSDPDKREIAAIDLSEKVSELPLDEKNAKEYIADTYKLDTAKVANFLDASDKIGFVDMENVDSSRKMIFNGNLFRRDEVRKINAICSHLSESDGR